MQTRAAQATSPSSPVLDVAVAGLRVVETRFAPHARIAEHHHEHAFFCFAIGGSFEETARGRAYRREPWSLLFHAPGEAHEDSFGGAGAACFNIEFPGAWNERIGDLVPALSARPALRGGLATWYAERLRQEVHFDGEHATLGVEGLALLVLAEASRTERASDAWSPPSWVFRVRDYLHDTSKGRPTIAEAAQLAASHPAHVSRVFRRTFRCSIGTYLRRLRVQHACRLLAARDRPLSEIALEAGFADQSHLTRVMQREMGMTPAEWRRRSRER